MGVRGLSTLVDDNKEDLLRDHKLHDTKVIIDGSNLYHFLYYHYNTPTQYGGDYDRYARKCRLFFNTLKMCNIEPYIVLDGGYDPDDRKLPAVIERMESRRLRAGFICVKGRGCVLPVLSYLTFRHVLVELGIPHVSSEYEADREIAVLANKWNCPVLSNDSDFFIYGMEGGYIPLDYINMTLCLYNSVTEEATVLETDYITKKNEHVYIPVKYYHYGHFVQRFRKKYSEFILPMFATLCGNDFINPSALSTFFAHIHVPKNPSKKAFNLKANTHMLAVLYWLDTMDSDEDALKNVVEHLPKEKTEKLEELVLKVFNDYRYIGKFSSLEMDSFLIKDSKEPIIDCAVPELKDFAGKPLPSWFVESLRSCSITGSFLQNVAVNRRAIFNCQIEMLKELSTYVCSRFIRSVIYGTIMKPDDVVEKSKRSRNNCIEEYDRDGKNTKKVYVQPLWLVPFNYRSIKVPSLCEIPKKSVEERKCILWACVGLNHELVKEITDDQSLVLIGLLSYWIKNANPKVTENHLNALIITVIMLHVRAVRWSKLKQDSGHIIAKQDLMTSLVEAIESQSDERVEKFVKHMEKHLVKPDQCSRSTRESRVIHGFSQFQACYLDLLYLNQVLQSPVHIPYPSVILNGTFLYNLCRDFDTRPKPDFYVAEILTQGSPLLSLFTSWKDKVIGLCKANEASASYHFDYKGDRVKTSSKKKSMPKKKKDKRLEKLPSDDDEGSGSETSSSQSSFQDLNNKFSLLGMED